MKYSLLKEWETVIGWPLPFEFAECYYNGCILQLSEDKLCFVYSLCFSYLEKNTSSICLTYFTPKGIAEERRLNLSKDILLPTRWNTKREPDSWLIYCDEAYQFEILTDGEVKRISIPKEVLSQRNLRHFSEDSFVFDRFLIEHKGAFGFVCTDTVTKEKLWTLKAQGYLYADMKRIGDRLFICTAEHGGFVYCVNILTGEIIYQVNTKGTAKIQFGKDFFVCYELGKSGKLLLVETETGQILDSVSIYKTSLDCPLLMIDDREIYVLSFRKTIKQASEAVLTKFTVSENTRLTIKSQDQNR